MNKQMAQLGVRGAVRRHDRARGRAHLPIHTPLRPNEHAIFGRSLLTKRLGIRLHQPGHDRLSNLAVLCRRGLEQGEVKQGIRMGMVTDERTYAHHDQLDT